MLMPMPMRPRRSPADLRIGAENLGIRRRNELLGGLNRHDAEQADEHKHILQ